MKDSPNLDLLRSCAVAFVVFGHLGLNLGWGRGFDIELIGRVGVAIFFVHTSLVLMMSLERSGGAAVPFFIRRFLRIYPLSVAMVSIVAAVVWLIHLPVDGWAVLSNLLLVQNITGHLSNPAPLWSLPYEVQMYLLLPAIYALTLGKQGTLRIMQLLAGSIAVIVALQAAAWDYHLLQYLPCFLPGVLAFALRRQATASPAILFALVAVGAIAVPALVTIDAPELPLLWALCLALGLTIPRCRQISSPALARAARIIAEHSYGIYLTHTIAIGFGLTVFPDLPMPAKLLLFACALFALARVGYRWIERPGIDLGIRLAARWSDSKPPRAAAPQGE